MRQESNNGIDLLLRELGRREETFSSELEAQHLDADELNSYVANALPAAARARYTAHLADCSSCRKMVAQLSAAEGVVVAAQPASVIEPSGLKSFLASLFSPMVLRYAIPALGVIVIAVVGIVVMRQQQENRSVALRANTDQNESVAQVPRAEASPQLFDQTAREPAAAKNNEVPKTAATPAAVPAAAKDAAREMHDDAASSTAAGAAPAAPVQETKTGATAAEAPPPAPAKAAPAEEEQRQQAEADKKKQDASGRVDANTSPRDYDVAKKEQKQADDGVSAPATGSANRVSGPQRARMSEADRGGSVANEPTTRDDFRRAPKSEINSLSSAERRTVAGREFRKNGNVWIDVAYNGQDTTIVKRDSDEYRSLIKDEPAINTIAETLKTEFVVVWKSRAYRVR